MTKISNKGFMLAEVVVVAVVVGTVLVTLFTGLNSLSSAYETRNRYYDVDSLYAAIEYNEILNRSGVSLEGIVTDSQELYSWALNINGIDEVFIQNYGVSYLENVGDYIISYITPYNEIDVLSLKSVFSNINNDTIKATKETFYDFIDYLSGNLDFNDDYNYMIIVERRENNNIDDCYYYALKLKY